MKHKLEIEISHASEFPNGNLGTSGLEKDKLTKMRQRTQNRIIHKLYIYSCQ